MELFNAGEKLKITKRYQSKLILDKVEATFPGRVQMCPLDFNAFEFGVPGGGGYGLAIELNNYIKIEKSDKELFDIDNNREIIIKHYYILMKNVLGIEDDFKITLKLDSIAKEHFGVGSSTSIAAVICYLFNYMCGNIISQDELVNIIANNYIEIYKNKLTFGMTTGVSLHSILKGEFVIVANGAKLIYSKKVPKEYKVVLIDTKLKRDDMDKPENMDQINRSKKLDLEFKKIRSDIFLMEIIPELNNDNWNVLFKYNNLFQRNGGQLAVIESYENNGELIKNILDYFSGYENVMIGVTSVGPTVFALVKDEKPIIEYCNLNHLEHQLYSISNGISILS